MSYEPRPNPSGDTLVASRDQIRTNFEIIQDRFEDDHTDYSTGTGKHDKSTYPEQSSAPTTGANEGAVYTKDSGGETELFYRRESNGSEIQLTAGISPSNTTDGHTFLPGGILLQWATFTASGGTNTTVTFSTAFSAAPYSVVCTMNRNASNVDTIYAHTLTSTTFRARNTSSSNRTVYYIAIGPA